MKKILPCLLFLVSVIVGLTALYWIFWKVASTGRPERQALEEELFEGIRYRRVVWNNPRPVVWHVIDIRISDRIEVFTTPRSPGCEMDTFARTTTDFAREFDADVAVNGSYFEPFHMNHYFDFYPHDGDPVNILGRAKQDGDFYSSDFPDYPVLSYDGRRMAIFENEVPSTERCFLAGKPMLVREGQVVWPFSEEPVYRRVAVGLNALGDRMWWVVADGKQEGYSEGVTFYELACFLQNLGARHAMALDGGGSSTLVYQAEDGACRILNAAFHTRFPMRERPVANHLGIRFR